MTSSVNLSNTEFDKIKASVLFQCIAFAFIVSLSPVKILGYCIPLFLLIMVLFKLLSKSMHKKLLIAAVIYTLVILFYFFRSRYYHYDFSTIGAVLTLLTYGSIIFVLIYPNFSVGVDSTQTEKLYRFLYILFVIETVVAIMQLGIFLVMNAISFDEATGDIVQGTINPLSFINSNVGFNNQVFTINYIFLLAYLLPYLVKNNRKYLIVTGGLVILLASVLHVVFSFLLAVLTCFLMIGIIRFRKQVMRFLVAGTILAGVLIVTQPKNISLIGFYYESSVSLESPKVLVIANTLGFLPQEYPGALITGLGPGQYTSRASLITSGHYFGDFEHPTKIPLLSTDATSKPFRDYIYDIWEGYATNVEQFGNSTMSRPFFSILSLLIEFGVIVFIILLIVFIKAVLRMRTKYLYAVKKNNKQVSYYSFLSMISIMFIFFLSFFENYLESSASICGGLLLARYFASLELNMIKS